MPSPESELRRARPSLGARVTRDRCERAIEVAYERAIWGYNPMYDVKSLRSSNMGLYPQRERPRERENLLDSSGARRQVCMKARSPRELTFARQRTVVHRVAVCLLRMEQGFVKRQLKYNLSGNEVYYAACSLLVTSKDLYGKLLGQQGFGLIIFA